ncbi:10990_t:CDS:10 [Entrophospora sp. SA101]|nr:10990_t:CDS:10 [Entrophospora sp. SA101]
MSGHSLITKDPTKLEKLLIFAQKGGIGKGIANQDITASDENDLMFFTGKGYCEGVIGTFRDSSNLIIQSHNSITPTPIITTTPNPINNGIDNEKNHGRISPSLKINNSSSVPPTHKGPEIIINQKMSTNMNALSDKDTEINQTYGLNSRNLNNSDNRMQVSPRTSPASSPKLAHSKSINQYSYNGQHSPRSASPISQNSINNYNNVPEYQMNQSMNPNIISNKVVVKQSKIPDMNVPKITLDYAPQTLQTPNEPLSAYESDVTTDDETEYIDRKEFNNSANSNESKSIKKKKDQILAIDEYGFVYDVSEEEIPPGADRIKRIIQAPGTEEKTTRVIRLYREREAKWLAILGTMDPNMARDSRKIKKLVRLGVPESVRGKSWQFMAGAEKYRKSKYYDELRNRPELPIYDVIERDINRCYPDHIQFRKETEDLHDILRAYAHYNPDIGYCQGMGRLVGMMLMQMPAEDTFWLLVATIDGYMSGYYTPTLTQIRIDAFVFEQLLAEHDPKLSQHLIDNDIIPLIYMTQWFMTLFTMTLPWASVLRIWDIFYFEGTNLFFRVGLAILDCVRDHILKNCPTSSEILSFILHIPHELLTPDPLLEATFKIKLKGSVIRRLAKKAAMIESGKENNNNSESADKSSSNNTSTSKKLKQSKSSENVKVNGVEFKLVGE